ncbi:MAG: ATP-binding protein [Elusimicrobiota bacterium]
MDYQPMPNAEAHLARQHPTEVYTSFLNCLGRAVKCVSLYGPSHPLSADYVKESLNQLMLIASRTRSDRLVLTLSGDRILVNDMRATETTQTREVLKFFFGAYDLTSITILAAASLAELSGLCVLAASPAQSSGESAFRELLARKGMTHILCISAPDKTESLTRTIVREPLPPSAPTPSAPAPSAPARRPSAFSFGSLLKTLVESAATNPEERLQLYQEAAGLVKEALNRRVDEATHELHAEKQRLVGEKVRTDQVLSTVADGKVIVDKEGKILMMNAAAESISGKRLIDMVGKHITESVNPEIQMVTMSEDLELPTNEKEAKQIRIIAQEEVERALRRSLALVQDDAGRLVGTYSTLPDVAKYKEALRMQDEFLSRVTHDLKAPLASISCGLEMLAARMGPKMAAEETSFVDICLRNTRQLGRMINEILDFSKLESGQMSVHPVATLVTTLLTETVEGLGPWAKTRDISLSAAPAPVGLTVIADPVRLIQILTNLVANAIKSTPAGGRIVVAAGSGTGKERGCAIFSVMDTGCGIPKEDLTRIFGKFYQVEATQERREGVGLGLAIVQDLVTLHRGRVWVESTVGEGSSFFFTIPLAGASAPAEALR